jgi:hypothetical protein
MSSIWDEELVSLYELSRFAKSHFISVWRWGLKGLPAKDGARVKLEMVRVGRRWMSSKEALIRFSEAIDPRDDDGEVPPRPVPRNFRKRQAASDKAAKRLQEAGI